MAHQSLACKRRIESPPPTVPKKTQFDPPSTLSNSLISNTNPSYSTNSTNRQSAHQYPTSVEILNLPISETQRSLAVIFQRYGKFNIVDMFFTRRHTAVVKSHDEDLDSLIKKAIQHQHPDLRLRTNVRIPTQRQAATRSDPTFSVVIKGVDMDVSPDEVSDELTNQNIPHVKVFRIRSRLTNQETTMMRVLVKSQEVVDYLLTNGFKMYFKLHRVEPSNPPPPQPAQCSKCLAFDHPAAECKKEVRCGRCAGPHFTSKCEATQPPKCLNCDGDHSSLDKRCPVRPSEPVSDNMTVKLKPTKAYEAFRDNIKSTSHICLSPLYLKATTTALLSIFPKKTEVIIQTMKSVAKQQFGRNLSVNFSGSTVHVTVSDFLYPTPLNTPDNPQPNLR